MQNRISRHSRSTVIPLTGRQGPDEIEEAAVDIKPPGNSCDTEQFTSLHDLALLGKKACQS